MSDIHARRDAQAALEMRLQARDGAAFCALYDETVSFVYRLASCVTDDQAAAAAVTEEVFRRVWQSPELISPDAGTTCDILAAIVHDTADHDLALRSSRTQRVRTLLGELTASQSSALNAVYFAGNSLPAAAAALGRSVIDVARDLRTAMVRLASVTALPFDATPDVA